jgi:repressor LexA
MALTRRQKQVLDFISGFVRGNGYSPSYEEIAEGVSLASLATVHKHISALERKGYVKRGFNQSRSIDITAKHFDEQRRQTPGTEVPLLGRIAAGSPVEAIAGSETLNFADFAGDKDTFALEVRGDSMIDEHICSGDYVLVERTSQVNNGDIVVALIDGSEATLKYFYRENDQARLQPANSQMAPIIVPLANVQIQGRVLAVIRKYR